MEVKVQIPVLLVLLNAVLMGAGATGEAKDLLVKLIDLLDKRGLVDAVNVVGDAMRNTETGKFITSTEPKK